MSLMFPTHASVHAPNHAGAVAEVATGISGGLLGVLDVLLTWNERLRQRRELLELDDHLLKDIGVTRVDAEWEGRKPFWRT